MTPSGTTPRRLGKVPALDGLRGAAIALVIALHVSLVAGGYIGVDVFLALSGFLITALLCDEWERTGGIAMGAFFSRRIRRLLPGLLVLVAVFTFVMLAFHPWQTRWPVGRVDLSTLLFVNNWVCSISPLHGTAIGAVSPTWTLAEEMQFYLVWPVLLKLLLTLRVRPRVVLAVIAATIAILYLGEPLVAHSFHDWNPYTSPLDRGCELLFGAAAAIVWRERMLPRLLYAWPVGLLLVAGITFMVIHYPMATPHTYLGAAALSALLIVNLLGGEPRPGTERRNPLKWLLGCRPMALTGRISYGIYLFHVPAYYLIWTYTPLHDRNRYGVVVFAVAWVLAFASWKLIEQPAMRLKLPRARRALRLGPALGGARPRRIVSDP